MPYEKVGKNEPVCIADEVPFEIPESWEWVRLESICTKLVDGDHNPPKGCSYETTYVMVSSTNINDDCIVELEKVRYLEKNIFDKENERTNATTGDIFFTSVGSLGRSCVYEGGLNICFQRSVSVIHTLIFNYYLKYCLDSAYIQQKIVREATGTAQKGFYLNQLALLLIPIPPIEEQHRIVSKYLKTVQMQKEYYKTNETLDVLNSGFPATLKKSILQYAVQGKLVPQDPADEPASVLLERIRAEKEQLIKAGKIKRDKHESVIFRRDNSHYEKLDGIERCIDDELPFEIPESWEWCRIGTIFSLQAGKNISSSAIKESEFTGSVKCYGGNGIRGYVAKANHHGDYPIIGRQGALCGNINRAIGDFYATEHAVCVDTFGDTNISWACLFLEALNLNQYATATAQPGLAVANINMVWIPLPPLEEQLRIVAKAEEAFPAIKAL